MGQCTGVSSFCAAGGYALESQYVSFALSSITLRSLVISPHRCHLGKIIKYDTVGKKGWSSNARTHPIKYIIDNLLNEDWEAGDPENGIEAREVPEAADEDEDCQVRFLLLTQKDMGC
jgi:putative lipase involved disintegration of autophagic bodies